MHAASVTASLVLGAVAAVFTLPATAQTPKPFFGSRGDARCLALNAWTDGIQARAPGVDLYAGVSLDVAVRFAEPSFADPIFQPAFGKTFTQLTDGDKKAIQTALEKCYGPSSWQNMLRTGFETNPRRMDITWRNTIARVTSGQTAAPPTASGRAGVPDPIQVTDGSPYLLFQGKPLLLKSLRLDPCPNLRTTDVYFAEDVYRAISGAPEHDSRGLVDGGRIDCSLKELKVTAADVASAATETFIRRLAGAGIAKSDAIKAMREGRFNPAWEDVALAWRGLVRMSPYALPPATIAAMQRDGRWKDGSPDPREYERIVLAARPRVWQEQFGSYESLPAGDFMRVLFESLAAGTQPPAAATARYATVRSSGPYGQRMAVIVRESAERRAVEEEKQRRLAAMSEGERLMAALDTLLSPLDKGFDQLDGVEESMLDSGGALFANSGAQGKGVPSVTLCNKTGTPLRLASLIGYRPRKDKLDPLAKTTYQVRGWSHLTVGQCGAVRVGGDNAAFLAIQRRSGNAFLPYDLPSDEISRSDTTVVRSRVIGADLKVCGKQAENFSLSAMEPAELAHCTAGYQLLPFNHAVQFGSTTEYTIDIR